MSRSCRFIRRGGRGRGGVADGEEEPAVGAQAGAGAGDAGETGGEAGEEGGACGSPSRCGRTVANPTGSRFGSRVSRFEGGSLEGASELGYEQTLEALLSLIGRQVLVLFSGVDGSPFISGVLSGRLDRGELDERLQEVLLRDDANAIETLFFHVGSRQNGFVLRPDEFERGFWRGDGQLVVQVGECAISVLVGGELGRALER